MNLFKVALTAYVMRAVCEKLGRDFLVVLRDYPRYYEQSARLARQFRERTIHAYKEMWG